MSMVLEKCLRGDIAIRYLLRLAIPLVGQGLKDLVAGFARDDGFRLYPRKYLAQAGQIS